MRVRLITLASLFTSTLIGQDTQGPEPRSVEGLAARLVDLDLRYTDWTLLRHLAEHAAAVGRDAGPVIDKAVRDAEARGAVRLQLRLLGVLAAVDDRGVKRLAEFVRGDGQQAAAIAARVLGRCGSQRDALGRTLAELLAGEKRPAIRSALALAAADAGVTSAAATIRGWLEAGDSSSNTVFMVLALAALSRDLEPEKIGAWLRSEGPMGQVGMLASRWHPDAGYEALLLEHLARTDDHASHDTARRWTIESLGVCGGDAAIDALRADLAAEPADVSDIPGGVVVASSELDPRRLALARLGEPAAVEWMVAAVAADGRGASGGTTFSLVSPRSARLFELFGKWGDADAADVLDARIRERAGSSLSRVLGARGLCWQKDVRGLEGAAALLIDPALTASERGMPESVTMAQQTLHEFVANANRPDCVVIDSWESAAALGRRWDAWIEAHRDALEWSAPTLLGEVDETVLW